MNVGFRRVPVGQRHYVVRYRAALFSIAGNELLFAAVVVVVVVAVDILPSFDLR